MIGKTECGKTKMKQNISILHYILLNRFCSYIIHINPLTFTFGFPHAGQKKNIKNI